MVPSVQVQKAIKQVKVKEIQKCNTSPDVQLSLKAGNNRWEYKTDLTCSVFLHLEQQHLSQINLLPSDGLQI